MSEEYKNGTVPGEEQVSQPVQMMQQPVTPVQPIQPMYDPYIYRLQQEQTMMRQPPKKPSLFKKLILLVGSAILFGALAGGAFIGVKVLEQKFGKKEETPIEDSGEGVNELEYKSPKTGILLQTSQEIGETSVTAVDVSAVAESAMPSVVAINNYSKQTYYYFYDYSSSDAVLASSGSGIIIGQNDREVLIVTNYHVVEGAERLSVQFVDGTTADAAVKGSASSSDLAVLAVKFEDLSDSTVESIRVARLGSSDDVKVGEIAIAVGNALGYGQSVTVGYISAKERQITIDKVTYTLIQTDAAINPGNSGGALLNKNGEVIGINSAKYEDYKVEGMGFAIPISNILSLINDLSNREEVKEEERAYLGIARGTDITDDLYAERFNIPKGLYVNEVAKGSAAEKAGIRQGDIIVRVDNSIIYGMSDLQEFLSYTKAGTEVEIAVYRANQGVYEEHVIRVVLDKRPARKKS